MQKLCSSAILCILLIVIICQSDCSITGHADQKTGNVAIQYGEKILENDNHCLDGTAMLNKNVYNKNDLFMIGGKLDYSYLPSKTDLSLQAINAGKFGTDLSLTAKQSILDNEQHRLDATARLSQNLDFAEAPLTVTGRLDYNYKPFDASVGVQVIDAGQFGTQAGVDLYKNIHNDKRSSWDVGAHYRQNFGGQFGTGAPTFGLGIRGRF